MGLWVRKTCCPLRVTVVSGHARWQFMPLRYTFWLECLLTIVTRLGTWCHHRHLRGHGSVPRRREKGHICQTMAGNCLRTELGCKTHLFGRPGQEGSERSGPVSHGFPHDRRRAIVILFAAHGDIRNYANTQRDIRPLSAGE